MYIKKSVAFSLKISHDGLEKSKQERRPSKNLYLPLFLPMLLLCPV